MKLRKVVTAGCLTALTLVAAPTPAAEAPQKAIGEETAFLVWIDVEQIKAEDIQKLGKAMKDLGDNPALAGQGAALPAGDLDEGIAKMTQFRDGFVQNGGEGLLLAMGIPAGEEWSPPISMLAKSKGQFDAAGMEKLIRTLAKDDADAKEGDITFIPIDGGWHDVSLVSPEGDAVTQELPTPNAAAFEAFQKQLGVVEDPVVAMAFRMQDDLRQMLAGAAQGAGQQQDPQAAMVMGMLQPIQKLDTVGFALSKVNETEMKLNVQMVFQDEASAQTFVGMYNSIIMFAPAMMAQQFAGVEGAPDPAQINAMFMKLKMQANGDTLTLELDQAFFDEIEKLAKLMEHIAGPPAGDDAPF